MKREAKKPYHVPIVEVQNIDENRDLTISRSPHGYTIAQKVAVEEGGKKFSVYLKNAVHIADIDCLEEIGKAISETVRIERERLAKS